MRLFYSIVTTTVLWLTPLFVVCGSLTSAEPTALKGRKPQHAMQLRLTTQIISEQYCKEAGSDTSDNLMIKLRLQYTNEGKAKLIFYKHDNTILRAMIKQDSADSANGPPLLDLSLTTVNGGKDLTLDRPVPSSSFATLAPGDSYDATAELIVFVRRGGRGSEADGLLPGNYSLQVIVSTWPESGSLAETLSKRWQSMGALWYQNVKSDPMRFKVERQPKMQKCPEP